MSSTTLDDVVSNLRALLLSTKSGIVFSEIDREYEDAFGPVGSLSKIGFNNLYEILRNSPGNFIFYGNCVLATVKSSSAHIANMVKEQKDQKYRRSQKFQRGLEVLCEHRSHKKHLKYKYQESSRHHSCRAREVAPRYEHSSRGRNSRSRGPTKYLDMSYRSHEIRKGKTEKSNTYNPNGWKFVSNALKQCGAIDGGRKKNRREYEKKDFSDDMIDKHNYTNFE